MTAPKLEQMKYWIIVPAEGTNQIKNPRFDTPEGVAGWNASGTGVTIESTGDEARWGAYSLKVNTVSGVASFAQYQNLVVKIGLSYTASCYLKGAAGQSMSMYVADVANNTKASVNFTATGYWQRVECSFTSTENKSDYYIAILRNAIASTDPFYVDGAQFEQASKATTFIHGYEPGCRWTGAARNSSSYRPGTLASGGELLCINDYAKVITSYGLGMGDWNQIMTKMTSGGDMYQTHIRKSRNFTLVLAYSGDNQGDLQANRKVILDALRPDLAEGQTRIIRYQGFDANGNEATNPIDIHCVFQPSHNDIPDMPVYQREMLNFTIPSGLLQGAYNEGKELDLYADFPAEYIVKRDPDGNWCKYNSGTGNYDSLITGLNGFVQCMAEGPDGKVYVGGDFTNAGGVTNADYLARWNPISEAWEAVIAGIPSYVHCMKFDANGDLYIGGFFTAIGAVTVNKIAKITSLYSGTAQANALNTGVDGYHLVSDLEIAPDGSLYIVGNFETVSGVANTLHIAKWDGTTWSALATGLAGAYPNSAVSCLRFAPNGNLYVGGEFLNADGTHGDYLCYWDGAAFHRIGTVELNGFVNDIEFDSSGNLFVVGEFTNAGGITNADYIAKWNGASWEALSTGTNGEVIDLAIISNKVYATGLFTTAGGLSLTDRVAVWANGAWQPLDIDLPGTGYVYSILPASDGSLYIGGDFSTAGETPDVNAETGIVALNLNVTSASANTYPFISVNGPGTLKSITNYRTGKSIAFDGLTLQAGEWISLSFDPLNLQFRGGWTGRGNLMRYVIPGSDYGDFYLSPGENYISVFMTDTTSASGATIAWTPLFWGLDGAVLE